MCSEANFLLSEKSWPNGKQSRDYRDFTQGDTLQQRFNNLVLSIYGDQWLLDSFNRPQVLVYDEAITVNVMMLFYNFFRQHACNVNNIIMINTCSTGVTDWWEGWKSHMNLESFIALELPLHGYWFQKLVSCADLNIDLSKKKIIKTFGFGSGITRQRPSLEREFLYFYFSSLRCQKNCDYSAEHISSRESLLGWVEEHSLYLDQALVDRIDSSYTQHYINNGLKLTHPQNIDQGFIHTDRYGEKYSSFGAGSFYEILNQDCWINVVRESFNDLPFMPNTEKSLFPLLLGCVPVGLCWQHDRVFTRMGLEMPSLYKDTLEFYSISNYTKRVSTIGQWLEKIENIPNDVRSDMYQQDMEKYQHNINLLKSGEIYSNLKSQFQEQCDRLIKS